MAFPYFFTRNETKKAGINAKIGNSNSGRELSGETNSPHRLGLGIFNGSSASMFSGHD